MMLHCLLAIDAGGTSTRAAVLERSGLCLGYGEAGGGNPVSAGYDGALTAVAAAAAMAVNDSGTAPQGISLALVAMAGASLRLQPAAIAERLAPLGVHGRVEIEADLLAMFHSGTYRRFGCVLVAGTGTVAARVAEDRIELVVDGTGWLLGDTGSGYWIGHCVARAVVAALDGRGPETALTDLMLIELGLEVTPERTHGRPRVLLELIEILYRMRPVELSRFAPLAFRAAARDPLAARIMSDAASALAGTLDVVRDPSAGRPFVIGGSIARALLAMPGNLADPLKGVLGNEVIPVSDGLVGAGVFGLRRAGIAVDRNVFRRIQQSVAASRAAPVPTNTSARTV
jgi:N-acetylglucosamine kinase-like BadF-type ATPase